MKINDKLKIRTIAGENIVTVPSSNPRESTMVISFNPTAKLLWDNLFGKEFTKDDAVRVLMDNFDIEESVAAADIDKWINQMTTARVITE